MCTSAAALALSLGHVFQNSLSVGKHAYILMHHAYPEGTLSTHANHDTRSHMICIYIHTYICICIYTYTSTIKPMFSHGEHTHTLTLIKTGKSTYP
jgi:hypothetical protein